MTDSLLTAVRETCRHFLSGLHNDKRCLLGDRIVAAPIRVRSGEVASPENPVLELPPVTRLKAIHRRPGWPVPVTTMKHRKKISRRGLPARETLVIDRSDMNKTVKTHHVEEQQTDGSWVTVHDERVEYPAKRRPR